MPLRSNQLRPFLFSKNYSKSFETHAILILDHIFEGFFNIGSTDRHLCITLPPYKMANILTGTKRKRQIELDYRFLGPRNWVSALNKIRAAEKSSCSNFLCPTFGLFPEAVPVQQP